MSSGGIDTDPNLVAIDNQHGDLDIFANEDGFAGAAGENQHASASLQMK